MRTCLVPAECAAVCCRQAKGASDMAAEKRASPLPSLTGSCLPNPATTKQAEQTLTVQLGSEQPSISISPVQRIVPVIEGRWSH